MARPLAISMPSVSPDWIRKQKCVYDWAWPPPARSAYRREAWSPVAFVNRTLWLPEWAVVESFAIVESAEESGFHWTSPDSKSSLNHVPGKRAAPESATDWEPPG